MGSVGQRVKAEMAVQTGRGLLISALLFTGIQPAEGEYEEGEEVEEDMTT